MRCTNCGLPLSPTRATTNCPRCGAPIGAAQGSDVQQQSFEQQNWGGNDMTQQSFGQPDGGIMQGQVQTPWGLATPPPGSLPFPMQGQQNQGGIRPDFQQSSFPPRRPYEQPRRPKNKNTKIMYTIAALCIILSTLILGFIAIMVFASGGKSATNTANADTTPQATSAPATVVAPTATPATDTSPTSTTYPGQQYITNAQMAAGVNATTLQAENPTTSFTSGASMYVIFSLNPPSQGGEVCAYWYLNNTQVGSVYSFAVKPGSHGSYTYEQFNPGTSGPAYVELDWANDSTCANQIVAQHIDFTVTAS